MSQTIRAVDLFCGAGGSSCGAREAGVEIVGAVDAWDVAIETYKLNFPNAETWCTPIQSITGKSLARKLKNVDLLLASPECTNHTFAKGNRRKGAAQEKSRRTAFEIIRFARALKPRWIVVENVVSMRRWKQYSKWKAKLKSLGYNLKEAVLDAQYFGVPQSRRRLFVIGDREQEPQLPNLAKTRLTPVANVLHAKQEINGFNYIMSPLFWRRPKRAKDTLARAKRAISSLGPNTPFLIVYYGTDAAGGWQPLDRPLRTITTLDRFALVRSTKQRHMMRMLQPPELAAAMGFPDDYVWPEVTRRERIKLVGNAVSPPVMTAIVSALKRGSSVSCTKRGAPASNHKCDR